jgi:hypothetical protein
MKTLMLFIALTMSAYAGAPVDSYKEMKVYPVLCTPMLSSLMGALTINSACLIFSGVDLQHFSRPDGMAPPKASINRNTET